MRNFELPHLLNKKNDYWLLFFVTSLSGLEIFFHRIAIYFGYFTPSTTFTTKPILLIQGIFIMIFLVGFVYLSILYFLLKGGHCRYFHLFKYEKILLLLVLLDCIALLIGLMFSNNPNYLISDFFKFLVIPLVWFLIRFVIKSPSVKGVIISFYTVVVFMLIANLLDLFYWFIEVNSTGILTRATKPYLLPLCVLPLILINKTEVSFFKRFLTYIFFSFMLLLTIVSGQRATWLASGLIFTALLIKYKMKFIKVFLVSLSILLLLFAVIRPGVFMETLSALIKSRLFMILAGSNISGKHVAVDASTYGRIYEVKVVWNTFIKRNNIFLFLFGFGNGAQYYAPLIHIFVPKLLYPDCIVHNIHIGYFAILFRYGIVGLLAFTMSAVFFIKYLLDLRKTKFLKVLDNNTVLVIVESILLSFIGTMIAFSFSFIFVGSAIWGILFGISSLIPVIYR